MKLSRRYYVLGMLMLMGLMLAVSAPVSATTYYSVGSLDPTNVANWNSNRDGTSGTAPTNFTTSGDVFVIQGSGNGGSTPHSMTETTGWTIGSGVTVEIENGATLTSNSPGLNTAQITFQSGSTFQIDGGGTYNHSCIGVFSSLFGGTENFAPTSNFIFNQGATETGPSTVT